MSGVDAHAFPTALQYPGLDSRGRWEATAVISRTSLPIRSPQGPAPADKPQQWSLLAGALPKAREPPLVERTYGSVVYLSKAFFPFETRAEVSENKEDDDAPACAPACAPASWPLVSRYRNRSVEARMLSMPLAA